jgi:hypothetical protein
MKKLRYILLCLLCSFTVPLTVTYGAVFPLKISSNKRHFVDQNNLPFLYHADTPWLIFYKLTKAEAEQYLEDRRQKRFTVVQVHILPDTKDRKTREGHSPFNSGSDFSTPNENFFNHVDWVINKAAEKGLAVAIAPAWLSCCGTGWKAEMNSNGANKSREFGRYLGKRYGKFNNVIMWIQGGDRNPEDNLDEIRAMVSGIKEFAPHQLHTAHASTPNSTLDIYRNEAWIDVNATYTYYPEHPYGPFHVYHKSLIDYKRSPVMPFFLSESIYEGQGLGTYGVRRVAYWSILSGSAGHAYGSRAWNFEGDWRSNMNLPGSSDMKHLYEVMSPRPWYKLIPDENHTVVVNGYGTYNRGGRGGDDYVTTASSADGTLAISYIPSTGTHSRTLTVDLSQFSGSVLAQWFNPNNGSYTKIGTYPNSGRRDFTSPGNNGDNANDWVLILETAQTTIRLSSGWNLISLPLQPNKTDVETVLQSIKLKYSVIYAYDAKKGEYSSYIPDDPASTLKTLEAGNGYWLYMDTDAVLEVTGNSPSKVKHLIRGWNLVGYNNSTAEQTSKVLSSIANKFLVIYGFDTALYAYKGYAPGELDDLKILEPGRGYWIYATEEITLSSPLW